MFDDELANSFKLWEMELEEDHSKFWNSLNKDDQLKAFCSVMRLLHKAELEEHGSYRYTLYDVFGFGPESYAQAQLSGFMAIHNAIWDGERLHSLINKLEDRVAAGFSEDAEKVKQIFNNFRKDQWF
jgi:hypothetical protein